MADYLNYVLSNPDLRENAEALGLTNAEMAEWGETHYENHGKNEGRENTPTAITNTEGYTQTLGERHYQGRDPYEVLQASVRSNYQGADADDTQMWEARENIADAWNLGQYTAEGWNLDPDSPYRTGILGNTIEVNPDIGQLVPTAAGNQRFLQDRYVDEAIANDFPVGWTTPQNTWAGPEDLGNYWDVLTNATRDDTGILGRVDPYDPATAVGPSVSPGPRGGGNVRPDRGGAGYGGALIGGPPNPTVPSFGYPQYQDWTRFMPTNFQLAEGGGMHYQPWATGTPQGGGGPYITGTATGGPYTGGGATATGGPGPINPNIWGNPNTTGTSNTTTDAQGNTWIMSNGQWIPTTSDLGRILASGNTSRHPLGHYDSNGMWVGAEGPDVAGNQAWGGGAFSPMEIASGIAGPNVPGMGNRQAGLSLLGRLGMFGNAFGATQPETGFGGETMSEAEVEASINGSGYGGGQWT